MKREEALLGHRVEVTVQAVDDDRSRAVFFNGFADEVRELTRSQLRRVHLLRGDEVLLHCRDQVHAHRGGSFQKTAAALVEDEERGPFAAFGPGYRVLRGPWRFSSPCWTPRQ